MFAHPVTLVEDRDTQRFGHPSFPMTLSIELGLDTFGDVTLDDASQSGCAETGRTLKTVIRNLEFGIWNAYQNSKFLNS